MANSMTEALDDIVADAATASASLATITAGSDAVVSNFAGLKDLVDELSAFATVMKNSTFYAPVGGVIPFGGSSAPSGWYLCDGRSWATLGLSAGDDLYDLMQPLGWAGVPDLKGRVPVGAGAGSGLTSRSLRDSGGGETLPQHNHFLSWDTGRLDIANTFNAAGGIGIMTNNANYGATNRYTDNTGTGSHGVMQPFLVLNYIIKG